MSSANDDDRRRTIRQTLATKAAAVLAESGGDGTSAPSVDERIEMLGFAGDARKVLDLLPLVLVAWSDGKIQKAERGQILDLVSRRGLDGGEAFTLIEVLLEERPPDNYMQAALALLRDLVTDGGASVVHLCIDVAAAARARGSFDPISNDERTAIAAIADTLGDSAGQELRRRLSL